MLEDKLSLIKNTSVHAEKSCTHAAKLNVHDKGQRVLPMYKRTTLTITTANAAA